MQPSRIVKSAYRRARAAGFKGSLKEFAIFTLDSAEHNPNAPAWTLLRGDADACRRWLANKAKQRKPSPNRKAAQGHVIVHAMADARSTQHTLRGDAANSGYSAREGSR